MDTNTRRVMRVAVGHLNAAADALQEVAIYYCKQRNVVGVVQEYQRAEVLRRQAFKLAQEASGENDPD